MSIVAIKSIFRCVSSINNRRKADEYGSGISRRLMPLLSVLGAMSFPIANANTVSDYQAVPPLLSSNAKPLVMLAMSNDHQLFYKAFTDYDDLDNDGVPETGYVHDIEYVGYFDSHKCYVYDSTTKYFSPVSYSEDKYCDVSAGNQWSGNFLNWSTMTRMDQIRRVLFGGYRYKESSYANMTILERAPLPNDAHSFAKYYNGADIAKLTPFGDGTGIHEHVPAGLLNNQNSGITLCNTTVDTDASTNNSSSVSSPPLVRVVAGNYHLWNANEIWQCRYSEEKSASNNNDPDKTGIHAASSNPSWSKRARQRDGASHGDYIVRVEVCREGHIGTEQCKEYPAGNLKPIGLLQKFGDSGQVEFGLVTGSYVKNKSGGMVRKDISTLDDEININGDGSFITGAGGIIETINLFRIANYNYGNSQYNDTDSCKWGKSSFIEGTCTNWGNPFSEILLECYRYFAGKQPNSDYDGDDSTAIPGISRIKPWTSPIGTDNYCAQMNVIAFNASTSSYDSDGLATFSDLNPEAGQTARTMTNKVGDGEGITDGKKFFVGEHDADKDQLCTAKEITHLGDVRGTCPDAPRLGGSYRAAGIAYHARINDIRTDLPEDQTVRTYGVTLSPAVPNVKIPVPGSDRMVQILPACRAIMDDGVEGNCGLVDFKVVENYVPTGNAGEYKGSFYVNWEDSEQGGDYDMDMYGMIRYTITSTTVTVETEVVHQAASIKMGFGFVISGTTKDGFYLFSGINSYDGFGCDDCASGDSAESESFVVGDSTASLLEQPLYYAAKWGGFIDKDGDGTPNLQEEWDSLDNATGELGSDGIPDTYFLAVNPKQLQEQLTNILVSILERTASGTSAAVVTNTGSGEGAIYQALYNPRFAADNGTDSVAWVGALNALFIDRYGHIREDNAAPKGRLTKDDNIVDIFYNPVNRRTQIQRYVLKEDGTIGDVVGNVTDVKNIKPIWDARDILGKVSDYVTQRTPYSEPANEGRYILTSVDVDKDGQVGMGSEETETFAFTPALFDTAGGNEYYRLLGLQSADAAEAENVVNYIRGAPVADYRNRRIDLDGDGSVEPVLLGDIIHSSPLSVGRPSAGYDITFADDTYKTFRQQYQNRRQVVYVGANDGMLHAFNAGFFNASTSGYDLKLDSETPHPLGSELWAYVPYNLLPHLQWLTKPDYPHVYYVDGAIKSYDVNIFPDDAIHPKGWGTILVVGMRFGGGDYTLDPEDDADGDPSDDITLRSGYVILDITDPESPPTVLAEITHEDMGYTVAEPDLLKLRAADPVTGSYSDPEKNDWYLVMASGPAGTGDVGRADALNKATSEKSAKLFVYDLKEHSLQTFDTGVANSFVGGVQSVDWTRDYIDDAVYFGLVGGTVESSSGGLYRGVLDTSGAQLAVRMTRVLDVADQPFSATPLTVRDPLGQLWVYSGTGRYYVVDDNFNQQQQSYYAVKEPHSSNVVSETEVKVADLVNTSDIRVYTDGSLDSKSNPGGDITITGAADPVTSFLDVVSAVKASDGWYFDFDRVRSRNITKTAISDQSLVFTEYQPSGLKCTPEGTGYLNAPHMQAGIPGHFAPLGTNPSSVNEEGAEEALMSESLGFGSPSAPSVHQRGDGKKVAVVQNSTGELTSTVIESGQTAGKRESWRELIIDWD